MRDPRQAAGLRRAGDVPHGRRRVTSRLGGSHPARLRATSERGVARHSSKTHPAYERDPEGRTENQGGQLVTQYPIDPFTPAVELAGAIRRKEVSPVEVVDGYLARIDELDPRLNAFCHRADDEARKAAAAAADAVVHATSTDDLPPFHGVPLPIKDLVDVAGWPTTHGSAGASRAPAARLRPGRAAVPGRGVRAAREDHHLRVRHRALHRERGPGHLPQPMGPRPHAGRLVERLGRGGGRRDGADRARRRRRRLDPHPGVVQRPRRAQAHPRPGHQRDRRLEGLATSGVLTRTVADTAAGLDVLARHDPAAWWSPPTPRRPSPAR